MIRSLTEGDKVIFLDLRAGSEQFRNFGFRHRISRKYPASSWFLLSQTREKPLRATVRSLELTAVQR